MPFCHAGPRQTTTLPIFAAGLLLADQSHFSTANSQISPESAQRFWCLPNSFRPSGIELVNPLRGACSVAPDLCLCMSLSRAARGWLHVRSPEMVMDCCSLRWIWWIPYRHTVAPTYHTYHRYHITSYHTRNHTGYHIHHNISHLSSNLDRITSSNDLSSLLSNYRLSNTLDYQIIYYYIA